MTELLNKHRSIRKYTGEQISDQLLRKLLTAGTRASTTGNMQVYSVISTQDKEMKDKLSPCHFNQPMVKEAPVLLTFCADIARFSHWCRLREAEPGYDNFLWFMTAAIDALLAAQNVCIAAESEGLGICYLGTTTYMADKIIEILELPDGVVPVTAVTLGYPAENPGLTDRLPLEAIWHKEKYARPSDKDIEGYYSEKESLASSQQFIKENQLDTLAQVFTEIRYKKPDNIAFSNRLLEVLKKQGFMNNVSN